MNLFGTPYRKGKAEIVIYKGIKFRRYPDSKHTCNRCYYVPESKAKRKGVDRLHREVYRDHFGKIPPGHDIHHKDGNALNNDPSNLECLESTKHNQHHKENYSEADRRRRRKWFLEKAHSKALNWHKSKEGREWHKAHGKRTWEDRQPERYTCEHCGQEYETLKRGENRFCGNNCRAAARRESGVDNETRKCERCNGEFVVNKYSKQRYCSRSCGSGFRYERRRGTNRGAAA